MEPPPHQRHFTGSSNHSAQSQPHYYDPNQQHQPSTSPSFAHAPLTNQRGVVPPSSSLGNVTPVATQTPGGLITRSTHPNDHSPHGDDGDGHSSKKPRLQGPSQSQSSDKDKDKDKGANKKANKDRKTRSRLACLACKSTKQKCDGPSQIPCRRCQLYNLECKFPPSSNVVIPTEIKPAPTAAESPAIVATKLQEIAARLRSIESALRMGATTHTATADGSSQGVSAPAHSVTEDNSDNDEDENEMEDGEHKDENAISELNMNVDRVVGPVTPKRSSTVEDYGAPDVIRRGILSAQDVQELFEFYFCSVHSWTMMLDMNDDCDAMAVRERSPLLFHTILLVSSAYSSPFPSQLHTTLTTFLNAIIAPQILSPQPHELTTDFLRALDLLLIYKPTQFAARRAEGKDDTDAVRLSKINDLASWMIQGIMARTVERLELSSVLGKFSRAYSSSSSGMAIPKKIVHDLRLYYWILSNDVHGNVQNGKRNNLEGHTALATTRLFSSLQLQPGDIRLAASVEMFEIARPIMRSFTYERSKKVAKADMERFTNGAAAWEEYWRPILMRQLPIDPLAMTVFCPFLWFITLTFNASALVTWKTSRHYASDSSGDEPRPVRRLRNEGARGLTDWELECLTRSVGAAEALIFTLAEESRVPGGWRSVQWEEAARVDGWRKLTLDDSIVDFSRWAMDALFINMSFALIFLCKLANEGLLHPNLILVRNPELQQPWKYTQKLPRLLELGAAFLDAIALNPHHPAKQQAQVLRALLDAGVKGVVLSPAAGPGPRHAGTVMSPSNPSPTSQPYQAGSLPAQAGGIGAPGAPVAASTQQGPHQLWPNPVAGQHAPDAHAQGPGMYSQPAQLNSLNPAPVMGEQQPPRTTALDDVLSTFDFGDQQAFWEWGAGPGLGSVDWNSLAQAAGGNMGR